MPPNLLRSVVAQCYRPGGCRQTRNFSSSTNAYYTHGGGTASRLEEGRQEVLRRYEESEKRWIEMLPSRKR